MKSEFNYAWANWAGNHSCVANYYFEPENENDVIDIVKKASSQNQKIRIAGSGHSFSPIVLSNQILLSLKKLNKVISIINNRVTVQSGITLKELYELLKENQLSLHNYGVINKQTLAGALATGTHGSGLHYKSLSSAIYSLKLIKADGTSIIITRNSEVTINNKKYNLLDAAGISLGLLGIVTEITLECEPLFYIRSEEKTVSLEEYLNHMDLWATDYDYFKGWWFPHTGKVYVYLANRISEESYKKEKKLEQYSPEQKKRDREIDNELASLFRQSLNEPLLTREINKEALEYYFTDRVKLGVAMDILVHDETVPMIVSEYALSMKNHHHIKALKEFCEFIEKNHTLHFPVDLRFSAGEDFYLSPSNGEHTFYIGMCVREYKGKEIPEVMNAFLQLMRKHKARPNWGKISDYSKNDLQKNFLSFDSFVAIRNEFDPNCRFTNEITDKWFT